MIALNGYTKKPMTYRLMTESEIRALSSGERIWVLDRNQELRTVKINGRVRTWVRDYNRLEIPTKYGMWEYRTYSLAEACESFAVIEDGDPGPPNQKPKWIPVFKAHTVRSGVTGSWSSILDTHEVYLPNTRKERPRDCGPLACFKTWEDALHFVRSHSPNGIRHRISFGLGLPSPDKKLWRVSSHDKPAYHMKNNLPKGTILVDAYLPLMECPNLQEGFWAIRDLMTYTPANPLVEIVPIPPAIQNHLVPEPVEQKEEHGTQPSNPNVGSV